MKHKGILAVFIVGFCIIFLGSIAYKLGQVVQRHAEIDSIYRDIDRASTANELNMALAQTAFAHFFITPGALMLALASAIGAWTIEDKYVKLGMLIFCALITTFLLAPNILTLTI